MKLKLIEYSIALLYCFSAVVKLIDFNNSKIFIAELITINLATANILLMLLIFIELIIALLLLTGKLKVKIFSTVLILITVGFIIINIFMLAKGYTNCGCFGTVIESSPLITIIKNLLVLFGVTYYKLSIEKLDTVYL